MKGPQMIRAVNTGEQPHEVAFAALAPGTTMDMVNAWSDGGFQGPPPISGLASSGVSALASGADAYFEADLAPGEYVLICFVTAPDGRPHSAHGMYREVRIVGGAQEDSASAATH